MCNAMPSGNQSVSKLYQINTGPYQKIELFYILFVFLCVHWNADPFSGNRWCNSLEFTLNIPKTMVWKVFFFCIMNINSMLAAYFYPNHYFIASINNWEHTGVHTYIQITRVIFMVYVCVSYIQVIYREKLCFLQFIASPPSPTLQNSQHNASVQGEVANFREFLEKTQNLMSTL